MLRSLADGIIIVALTLAWVAAGWVAADLFFADPAVIVFEDVAIICAVLSPILCLIGWSLRWLGGGVPARGAGRA